MSKAVDEKRLTINVRYCKIIKADITNGGEFYK